MRAKRFEPLSVKAPEPLESQTDIVITLWRSGARRQAIGKRSIRISGERHERAASRTFRSRLTYDVRNGIGGGIELGAAPLRARAVNPANLPRCQRRAVVGGASGIRRPPSG